MRSEALCLRRATGCRMIRVSRGLLPAVVVLALGLLLAGCGGGGVSVGPRPAGVPYSARPVEKDASFGRVTHLPGGTVQANDAPTIDSIECHQDVVTVTTNGSKIYAALPCDRFPAGVGALAGQRAAIRLTVTPRKLFIESQQGQQIEFSPRDMWVE